jgi:TolA-binding protein
MGRKQRGPGKHIYIFLACIMITLCLTGGCAHYYEGFVTAPDFNEANDLMKQGDYKASVRKFDQILSRHPRVGDKVLFETGILHAFPKNQQKDYLKSLDCFQKLVKDYPQSSYRQNSEVMISLLNEIVSTDKKVIGQRKQIDTLEHQASKSEQQISKLEQQNSKLDQQIGKLEQQVAEFEKKIAQMKEIDMNLNQRKKALPKP